MIKVKCNIDTKSFQNKPNEEQIKSIIYRTKSVEQIQDVTIQELANKIKNGYSFTVAEMQGRGAKDWKSQSLFVVDIDNENSKKPILKPLECVEILQNNNLHYAFIYYSYSYTKEKPKYRVVCRSREVVTNPEVANKMNKGFISLFDQADKSCKNLDRLYYGTNKAVGNIHNETFDNEILLSLYKNIEPLPEPIKCKSSLLPPTREGSFINLSEAYRNFDLLNYIRMTNNVKAERRGKDFVVVPNPFNFNNRPSFYIDTESKPQRYKCFSTDTGGNILNYIMTKHNIDINLARDYFKYNILGVDREEELKEYNRQIAKVGGGVHGGA